MECRISLAAPESARLFVIAAPKSRNAATMSLYVEETPGTPVRRSRRLNQQLEPTAVDANVDDKNPIEQAAEKSSNGSVATVERFGGSSVLPMRSLASRAPIWCQMIVELALMHVYGLIGMVGLVLFMEFLSQPGWDDGSGLVDIFEMASKTFGKVQTGLLIYVGTLSCIAVILHKGKQTMIAEQ